MDFSAYCDLTEAELAQRDIAEVNLTLATGLPGSEQLNVDPCLATLDRWAAQIQEKSQQYLPRFERNPSEFFNSENQFGILCMITVLQRDLGVRYNAQHAKSGRAKVERQVPS